MPNGEKKVQEVNDVIKQIINEIQSMRAEHIMALEKQLTGVYPKTEKEYLLLKHKEIEIRVLMVILRKDYNSTLSVLNAALNIFKE